MKTTNLVNSGWRMLVGSTGPKAGSSPARLIHFRWHSRRISSPVTKTLMVTNAGGTTSLLMTRSGFESRWSSQKHEGQSSMVERAKLFHRSCRRHLTEVGESQLRRRRSLISAQGWSVATTLGSSIKSDLNPERVYHGANPFRVRTKFEL